MSYQNPYLDTLEENFEYKQDELLDIDGYNRYSEDLDTDRRDLVQKYAWAIPNKAAIELIADRSPIVEIGAGSGYWAHLISASDGEIVAFDDKSREYETEWFDVQDGSADIVGEFSDRTLFLCWPEYRNSMGEVAVENYSGSTIILVGESISGCTGTDDMYRMIQSEYDLERTVEIPRWYGIKDSLYLYER